MKEIILASASPRRKELLKNIVSDFKIIPSNIKEEYPNDLNLLDVALYISDLKANDIYLKHSDSIVIGCDTAIVFNNKIIGKPKNKEDARETLTMLSNNVHYVTSGVTIYCDNNKYQINSINKVYFKKLSLEQIDNYLSCDEYKDKAGSYAIQGIAKEFIEKIEGEYESIVGLPIKDLKPLLKRINK